MDRVRDIKPVIRLHQFDDPRRQQKRKQPNSANALAEVQKFRIEEDDRQKRHNDMWFVQGKRYSHKANKYGEGFEAEVCLSASRVLENAYTKAQLWMNHLGHKKPNNLLTLPALQSKLEALHRKLSRTGWTLTAENSCTQWWYGADRGGVRHQQLITQTTDRLEELSWNLEELVREVQHSRKQNKGFT
jgi:hypothetical protein